MEKTIRIWNGPQVIGLFSFNQNGSMSASGATGGAENSMKVDIELDPFRGLIVDHGTRNSPVDFREQQQ